MFEPISNAHKMILILSFIFIWLSMRVYSLPVSADATPVSPCFLTCTTIALPTGCSSLADLACLCANQAFQAVLTACIHQQCPDEDESAAQLQAQECAGQSASVSSGSIVPASSTTSRAAIVTTSPMSSSSSTTSSQSSSSSINDVISELYGTSTPGYSERTAIVVGSVIGFVILMMLGLFLLWWFKEGRLSSIELVHKNQMAISSPSEGSPTYRDHTGTITPWVYPANSSSPSHSTEQLNTSRPTESETNLPRPHPFLAIASLPNRSRPRERESRNYIRPFILPPLVRERVDSNTTDRRAHPAVAIKSKKRGRISLGLPPPAYEEASDYLDSRPSSSGSRTGTIPTSSGHT